MRWLNPPDGPYVRDCVVYLRKSKGRTGIPRQRTAAEVMAKRLNWRIVAEFEDVDTTAFTRVGDTPTRRDDYEAMIITLRQDQREVPLGVLALHADRLHREVTEGKAFIEVCAAGKHPVETARSGSYDLNTSTGCKRFIADVNDAEFEVAHMSERHREAKDEAAREGRWLGGPAPFGWRAVRLEEDGRKILVIDPEQAAAIAWGSEALLLGKTLGFISREWRRRGLKQTRGGDAWEVPVVHHILRRPRNAGLMVHRGKVIETVLPGGKAEWEPIVSEEVWRAVAQILKDPERRTSPAPGRRWLGSGLYVCGALDGNGVECGHAMRMGTTPTAGKREDGRKKHLSAYRCKMDGPGHARRHASTLDAFVEATIIARLSKPDVKAVLLSQGSPGDEALRVELAIEELNLADWRQQALEPDASPILIANGERATRGRIAEIKKKIDQMTVSPMLRELAEAENIKQLWDSKDLIWKRAVLDKFVRVVILKAPRGRPAGWVPGQPYFDPTAIFFDWKPLGATAPQD